MKKKVIVILLVIGVCNTLLLSACGNSVKEELVPYEGNWIAIVAEMFGIQTSVQEAIGGTMQFEVKNTGKVEIVVGDDQGSGTCSVENDQFTLVLDGEEMHGKIDGDTITFDNMLGLGVKVIFAKEGTEAMDPSNYLTEDDKAIIGQWSSKTVAEILGDGPQTTFAGVEDIHDALRLDFKASHQVSLTYKGEPVGEFKWESALGSYTIDTEKPSLYLVRNDDQTLSVTYSSDDDYYEFVCEKDN